jgi:Spy/CpxP family protein refolding chaperone
MKRLFIIALLALPFTAVAQETAPLPPDLPPLPEQGTFVAQVRTTKKGPGGTGDVIYFRRSLGMGNWWKNSDVVKQLGTSDAQVQQIERIYQDSRMRLIDLKANLEKEEARLEPLVEADNPDEGLISSQIDKVAAARAELEKSNALMQVAIRRVLTLDQWKKLQVLQPTLGAGQYRFTMPLPPPPPPAAPAHVVAPAAPAHVIVPAPPPPRM